MSEFDHRSTTFGHINLNELSGVQTALARLGFDPGSADGKNGPKTESAVKNFQTACMIPSDGIVGPATRGCLKTALDNAASKASA